MQNAVVHVNVSRKWLREILMFVGQIYSPIGVGEVDIFTIDITNLLTNGRTVSSVTWTCAVSKTAPGAIVDPSPGSRIIGISSQSTSSGKTTTSQRIGNMVAGNFYILTAQLTTSDGCFLEPYSYVCCTAES